MSLDAKMAQKIAIVILNYNGCELLRRFLPSVVERSRSAEVWVADNGSTDGSIEFVRRSVPEVKVLLLGQNLGFATGYNRALSRIDADIYVLLNSDVEVTDGWLEPCTHFLATHDEVAACQPKILSLSEPSKFEYAGAAGGFIDDDGYPFCRGRLFDERETDAEQYDEDCEAFWASGACLFVRARDFHDTGGFDEDFFAHMEEIDLCWRLKNAGRRIWCCAGSHVYHLGGGTLEYGSARKTLLNFRNSLFMLLKNDHDSSVTVRILRRTLLDGVALVRFLAVGKARHALAVAAAHFGFYRKLPVMLGKRRFLRAQRKDHTCSQRLRGSILFEYFIRGAKSYRDLDPGRFRGSAAASTRDPLRV